jgi:hypothetical protein
MWVAEVSTEPAVNKARASHDEARRRARLSVIRVANAPCSWGVLEFETPALDSLEVERNVSRRLCDGAGDGLHADRPGFPPSARLPMELSLVGGFGRCGSPTPALTAASNQRVRRRCSPAEGPDPVGPTTTP